MIPFASQRGTGQDLAVHLLNEHDNEYMEVAELRGAVADDLPGAFAEWEAQAHALTRCKNYLYSLSINPDNRQGELTREQYFDYIERAEERLGLSGQPRAVVFHIKHGREHCHVVWSRIDPFNEKAIHMAFDHDKLMMVTREFARDHGLGLPDGYFKEKGAEKTRQESVYDMAKARASGLSKADHIEAVTDAWRASDNARAFVQALADKGYMLATGKRPYVLVDFYGGMHALPRLIGDKSVRTKDIREFLEKDYPPESLPSVEEAKALIAEHRKSVEAHLKFEQRAEAIDALKRNQATRRAEQETALAELKQRQHLERLQSAARQRADRDVLRADYLAEARHIKQERYRNRPTGLAAFLGRVTGVELIRKKLQQRQDKKRLHTYLEQHTGLRQKQHCERTELQRRQEMQSLDTQRKIRALEQVERKELKSLEESLKQQARIRARGGRTQMPSLGLELTPPGRKAVPHKTKDRHNSDFAREKFRQAQSGERHPKEVDLSGDFDRAADDGRSDSVGGASSEGRKPTAHPKNRRYGRKRRGDNDLDRGR